MYAKVTRTKVRLEKLDENIRLYRDVHALPVLQQQEGFNGALLLVDRTTGKCLSITLWESHEAMRGARSNASYQAMTEEFKEFFAVFGTPTQEQYEVVVQAGLDVPEPSKVR